MTTIAADHARSDFDGLLRRAAEGEEILITQHGQPVARLVPVGPGSGDEGEPKKRRPMTLEELREFRKNITLGPDLTIKQLIEEGRR